MPAAARTQTVIMGKEIVFAIEKVPGSNNYINYLCTTSNNITNPGTTTDKVACFGGTYTVSNGDADPAAVKLETIRRAFASADQATNFADSELWPLVVSGDSRNVKIYFGNKAGDQVITGKGFFNQQEISGSTTGAATGGVTFNFSEQPTVDVVA